MDKKQMGALAASALAGLLMASPVTAGPKMVDGHYCSPTCKGKSDCGGMGNKNGCSGSNECAGKGWIDAADKDACKEAGGKWKMAKGKKKKKMKKKKMKKES